MKLGDFTMPAHPPGYDYTETLQEDLERIIALDQLGYQETWIGEHFTSAWENIPANDLFIARCIGETQNIRLGTGVTCMPSHNPFSVAHRIAQLDHMLKGRFNWGVGPGGFPGDLIAMNIDPKTGKNRELTRQAVDLVLQLWDDPKPGRYKNEFWDFTVPEPWPEIGMRFHIKPYQKPHPPIAVAGSRPQSATLVQAGERDWIPISINFLPWAEVKSQWSSVEEGAKKAGRVADRRKWRIARDIYVADTTEQARKEALEGPIGIAYEQYVLRILSKIPGRIQQLKKDPNMADSDVTPEYMMDHVWMVGSPDDVAKQIRDLYEYVGGFGVLVTVGHEWKPADKWRHSHELLVNEVMPQLADLVPTPGT
ncbi:MAG: LLM class flavin-dependent oxidoreductase [Chloroflexi bacterium]|nr:LLM class flavin-dependent oxidoreductase [Chloroflexota bacterium]